MCVLTSQDMVLDGSFVHYHCASVVAIAEGATIEAALALGLCQSIVEPLLICVGQEGCQMVESS